MIRAFASGTGGIGLDPGPRDTKNVKNGTKKYLASLALIIHKSNSPKKITSVMGIQLLRWWLVTGSLVLSRTVYRYTVLGSIIR